MSKAEELAANWYNPHEEKEEFELLTDELKRFGEECFNAGAEQMESGCPVCCHTGSVPMPGCTACNGTGKGLSKKYGTFKDFNNV